MISTIKKAYWKKYVLDFKNPSGTSRGIMKQRETWFLFIEDTNGNIGVGECGMLRGLSCDDVSDFEKTLEKICNTITDFIQNTEALSEFPSIIFGLETAILDLKNKKQGILFPAIFKNTLPKMPINGLIWMGDSEFQWKQVEEKIAGGYTCIKLKISGKTFEEDVLLIEKIRKYFGSKIEIRVDANGSLDIHSVDEQLDILNQFNIHSIEQPIAVNQIDFLAELCSKTAVDIALDEELIGIHTLKEKKALLEKVKPQYIILKPSLHGGFSGCDAWIELAEKNNIGWWMTSALESSVGLNAIAQYTANKKITIPQGLGTGSLYTNNLPAMWQTNQGFIEFNTAFEPIDWEHVFG